ncbi:TrmJ/YjtD family RNA methyltransferase [Novosphingobium sp.]|uniref:TrmJ/YjtD family RNA methyltransferase n=1 Tax=Novosphingobium sp. TaxID=1874826 RepID=UPI00273362A4|nr:TrmJ/YjtD family RNA methyltransferase [Novosphingobium sp.]MDP3907114.1 TrmJ/YjtD family RNA methyltransferase [Novosphingobium sp.]
MTPHFWTYMLRCSDGGYYIGHTDDLDLRVAQHNAGTLGGYTATRLPVALVWSDTFADCDAAFAAERKLKGWSRAKKEALIAGDWALVSQLARRAGGAVLRDGTSTSSAPPQDERVSQSLAAPEERAIQPTARPAEPATQTFAHPEERSGLSLSKAAPRLEGRHAPPPKPVIVLVRPQLGENIGKAARAMLNFGLTELRLVTPRDGWPNPSAGPAAAGADEVLEHAAVFESLADAVSDCAHVYATTVRKRGVTKPVVTPEQAAQAIHRDAAIGSAGRSALVFGPERSGLETEDVALARAILTVPINPAFASLNLAQAVILCAYEWSKQVDLAQPTVEDLLPPAPQEDLEGMLGQLEAMLDARDYFFPPARAEATRLALRNILTKPGWNYLEVRTLRGVLSNLHKRAPKA